MPFIEGFCEFFRGNMVQKWPIWGHHTPLHRFYGIKRWKKERKEIAFLDTAIPPCSQWPSLSGKLHVSKIRGVQLKSKKIIIFCKKWELLWPLLLATRTMLVSNWKLKSIIYHISCKKIETFVRTVNCNYCTVQVPGTQVHVVRAVIHVHVHVRE